MHQFERAIDMAVPLDVTVKRGPNWAELPEMRPSGDR